MPGTLGRVMIAVLSVLLVVFSDSLGGISIAWGDHGSVVTLPTFGKKLKSGLTVEVDTRWVDGAGYQPVRVTVTTLPPVPTLADRTIRVEITPNSWSDGYGATRVSQFIELPQGSSSATGTLLVPRGQEWQQLSVACYEGGVPLEDLTERIGIPNFGNNGWDDSLPSILFINERAPLFSQRPNARTNWSQADQVRLAKSHDLPDIRRFAAMFPRQNGASSLNPNNPTSDFETLAAMLECPQMEFLSFADLPDRWLAYSSIDITFIKFDELQKLQNTHPPKWVALREWLTAGGTLIVYGVGPNFKELRKLETALEIPADHLPDDKRPYAGWTPADPAKWDATLADIPALFQKNANGTPNPYMPQTQPAVQTGTVTPESRTEPKPNRPKDVSFAWRQCGLGRVVALDGENPFAQEGPEYWGWLLSSLGNSQWVWTTRHGVSLTRTNDEFWNFLIPGVGRAPIGAFLLLISLFMLAIGPVNYYLLRRRGRLVFLLLTVPAGASVVTVALLLYAVVADGLGVRVRVRSFTALDQRRAAAVSWSRQSYYAGVAPSRGLSFPLDTAVYPLEHFPPGQYENRPSRRLDWTDDAQVLAGGFMGSRVSSQFIVIRAAGSRAHIALQENNAQGTPPTAKNELGSMIRQVLLCDEHGDLYWGEEIADNGAIDWSPIKEVEARKRLSEEMTENAPQYPEGYEANYFLQSRSWRRARYYVPNNWSGNATQSTGLLEMNLAQAGNLATPHPAKRSYYAIVDRCRDIPLGTRAAETASFHVIQGRW